MLHEFLSTNTQEIIARTRAMSSTRTARVPTEAQLDNGAPLFLRQLIDRLRLVTTDSQAIEHSATLHGGELLALGFTVSQVVHGYGDLCQVITAMAHETDAPITAGEFHTFNGCLDDAIAHSVTGYDRQRDKSIAFDGVERLGGLAHELRNRLTAATLAFTVLRERSVGGGGSAGAVLGRNLRALRDIINDAVAGVRLESGIGRRGRIVVSDLIAQVKVEASLEAAAGGLRLDVSMVPPGAAVEGDPQMLSAALANLLSRGGRESKVEADPAGKGPPIGADESVVGGVTLGIEARRRPDREPLGRKEVEAHANPSTEALVARGAIDVEEGIAEGDVGHRPDQPVPEVEAEIRIELVHGFAAPVVGLAQVGSLEEGVEADRAKAEPKVRPPREAAGVERVGLDREAAGLKRNTALGLHLDRAHVRDFVADKRAQMDDVGGVRQAARVRDGGGGERQREDRYLWDRSWHRSAIGSSLHVASPWV